MAVLPGHFWDITIYWYFLLKQESLGPLSHACERKEYKVRCSRIKLRGQYGGCCFCELFGASCPSAWSCMLTGVVFLFCFVFSNFCWHIVNLQCCVSFRCTVKWISFLYIYSLFFFKDSFPMKIITEYCVEFPVLCNRLLLAVYFIYSSVYVHRGF